MGWSRRGGGGVVRGRWDCGRAMLASESARGGGCVSTVAVSGWQEWASLVGVCGSDGYGEHSWQCEIWEAMKQVLAFVHVWARSFARWLMAQWGPSGGADKVSTEETSEEHASGIALTQIAGNSGLDPGSWSVDGSALAGKAVSAVDEVSTGETNEEHASGIALAQIAGNSGLDPGS